MLRAFHHAGVDLNARGPDGRPLLHRATIMRQPAQVRALLAAGADINARDNDGRTALHLADTGVFNVPTPTLALDAETDAEPRVSAESVRLAQHAVATLTNPAQRERILGHLDVLAQRAAAVVLDDLPVPAHHDVEMPAALQAAHEDPIADVDHEDAVDIAPLDDVQHQHDEAWEPVQGIERQAQLPAGVMQRHIQQFRHQRQDEERQTNIAIIDALLSVPGINIDAIDHHGNTPLHTAIGANHLILIDKLIASEVNHAIANADGDTALHFAPLYDYPGLIPKLIAAGADIGATNRRGETVLDIVLGQHAPSTDDTLALLAAGAKIDPTNAATLTAFHRAITFGSRDAIALLLCAGIDINHPSARGHTALEIAMFLRAADNKLREQLLAAGATIDPENPLNIRALHHFVEESNVGAVYFLVGAGVDINHPTPLGATALETAFQIGIPDMAIARLLINAGAQIRPDRSMTVDGLIAAARNNHTDITQALLSRGVDVNARDVHRRTALQMAVRAGSRETVALLLEQPTLDVNASINGDPAFALAMHYGHNDIAAALLAHPDADPNRALIYPDLVPILLRRAGLDQLQNAEDRIRLLTFCADFRPRVGQLNLGLIAHTNFHLGVLLSQSSIDGDVQRPGVARLALSLSQDLQAYRVYRPRFHPVIAKELLTADPDATDFLIGRALIPREELENMTNAEVYYARREGNALLEQDINAITHDGVTANVHQAGFAQLEISALELLQQRDAIRQPIMTLEEATNSAFAMLEPRGEAQQTATDVIAEKLVRLEPENTDRTKRLHFATKQEIRRWIDEDNETADNRDALTAAWQIYLARYGLEHALAQTEPVNENGLDITTPEVIRLLIADEAYRPGLQDNLKAAFKQRLIDIGGDPEPCNVGCAGRLLTTQFRVVPELMDGAPDPKTLPAEFNDIAKRVSVHFNIELEQAHAEGLSADDISAMRDNAATIKHDLFTNTVAMLLRLRDLPQDSVKDHVAQIKEGFMQEMY